VEAERAMNRALHGSCHVPVGAFAQEDADGMSLRGLVGSAELGTLVHAQASSASLTPENLGHQVAQALLANGADALLAGLDL
jgi:hydroxymethylbilane synthase